VLGAGHYLVADALVKVALVETERKRFDEADALLLRARGIASKALGERSELAKDILYNLAANAARAGRSGLALDRLEEGLALGIDDPELRTDPELASLLGEPRFEAVATAMIEKRRASERR
jgi:hypothetical protein